jgi:hypothetical protein
MASDDVLSCLRREFVYLRVVVRSNQATMIKLILTRLFLWIVSCVVFVLASEDILEWLMPGSHTIEMWLTLLSYGLGLITLLQSIWFVMTYFRRRAQKKNG